MVCLSIIYIIPRNHDLVLFNYTNVQGDQDKIYYFADVQIFSYYLLLLYLFVIYFQMKKTTEITDISVSSVS